MFGRLGLHSIHLRLERILTAAAPLVLEAFHHQTCPVQPDMPNQLLEEGNPSATLLLRILGEH